jgi:hypothetical protein
MGEHENLGVVRRILTPPPVPRPVPLAPHRAEHVPAHDVRPGRRDLVELGPVLVGVLEHPGVQPVAPAVTAVVAEGAFLGLVRPGPVAVGRDGDVGDDLAHDVPPWWSDEMPLPQA